MRTKHQIFCLKGHTSTVASILVNETDPQVVTGSMDSTIRTWDLTAGKTITTLTHHKKSVRALASHPRDFTFVSGAADNIKQWRLPRAEFLQNMGTSKTNLEYMKHRGIVNCVSTNADDVVFAGGACRPYLLLMFY